MWEENFVKIVFVWHIRWVSGNGNGDSNTKIKRTKKEHSNK